MNSHFLSPLFRYIIWIFVSQKLIPSQWNKWSSSKIPWFQGKYHDSLKNPEFANPINNYLKLRIGLDNFEAYIIKSQNLD